MDTKFQMVKVVVLLVMLCTETFCSETTTSKMGKLLIVQSRFANIITATGQWPQLVTILYHVQSGTVKPPPH